MAQRALAWAAPLLAAVLSGCGGGGQAEPAPAVPKATATVEEPPPEGDLSATLEVIAGSPTEILLDGKPIGKTPISGYKITPGPHDVTFVDEANGNRTMGIDVLPGDAKTVQSDPPPAANEAMKAEPAKKK